jgi:Mn2+/Fe2+ NRAMP family transporter
MDQNALKRDVEEAFKAPAELLEDVIDELGRAERSVGRRSSLKRAGQYWQTLGPGLTTGAADDDPSGIATYSQAGAQYGLQLIWMPLYIFPFMASVQEMCARIGLVSGEGLAANIRRHYAPGTLYAVTALLFFANVLNIAADLGAMAASTRLLFPGFGVEVLVIFFALVSLVLQVFTSYARYSRYLKYLAFALFAYVAVALIAHLDWGTVLYHTLVPTVVFSRDQLFLICAVFGTTISPYLFFWQTSQEVEEGILHGEKSVQARKRLVTNAGVRAMRIDVWSGMFFSILVSFFIFAACAGTLFAHGITHIATAEQAAAALRPFGEVAYWIFALGIVGTGLLAVPVLAGSTAYALAESLGWRSGLYRKLKQAYAFYGVIIVSMLLGVALNFAHLDPIRGLIYAAVANGVIAPIVLFFVVRLSGNRRIMGEHANGKGLLFMGWVTIAVMSVSGIAALLSFF